MAYSILQNGKLSKADQAAIDSARRLYNIIGARIVDADMNVLGVIDDKGVAEILIGGVAAYIHHASGWMSSCGPEIGNFCRIPVAMLSEKSSLTILPTTLRMRVSCEVYADIDMLDKAFSTDQVVETSAGWAVVPVVPPDSPMEGANQGMDTVRAD